MLYHLRITKNFDFRISDERYEYYKKQKVVIIMSFLTQNPCTPPYKTPVIFYHILFPCLFSVIFYDKKRVLKKCQKQSHSDFQNFPKFIKLTKIRKKINVKECDILMARLLRSLAGVFVWEVQGFQVRKDIITTHLYLSTPIINEKGKVFYNSSQLLRIFS